MSGPAGVGRKKLGTLFLVVFIDLVGFGMIIPILPLYAEKYQPSGLVFGLFMASFSAMQFLISPLLGSLSDRVGRKPVLVLSMIGAAAGYALLAVADSMTLLFISRIVAGACGANIATAQAVIADVTGPEGRTRAMGIIGAAFGLGFIFGPAIGGVLVHFGEQWPGAAASGTSLLAALLVVLLVPETLERGAGPRRGRRLLDIPALRRASAHAWLGLCLLLILIIITSFSGFETTFAQFLKQRFELSTRNIAFLFVYAGVLAAIVQGGVVGRLARRVGEARLVNIGIACAAVSLAAVPLAPSLPVLLLVLAVLAFGIGVTTPTLAALTSHSAPAGEVGQVMGLYQSLSSLGRIAGPFLGELAFHRGAAWTYFGGAVLLAWALMIATRLLLRVPADLTAARAEEPAG